MEGAVGVLDHEGEVVGFWGGSGKDLEEGELLADVGILEILPETFHQSLNAFQLIHLFHLTARHLNLSLVSLITRHHPLNHFQYMYLLPLFKISFPYKIICLANFCQMYRKEYKSIKMSKHYIE